MPTQELNRKIINADGTVSYVSGATAQDTNTAITAASLAPVAPLNPVQPDSTPIAPVAGLNAELTPLAPLPQENAQSDLIKQIQGLTMDTTGEAGFRAQQEQAQGIPELQKTQSDLSARLKTLQNEALAIPLQLQQEATGRGITAGGLRPIESAALRNNAIQSLSVSSLLEASRGNLTTAQSLADRAVAQKYDPIKAEIQAKLANLELLSKDPTLTLAQKNRLDEQKAVQEQRQAEAAQAEAASKEINSTLNLAIKYGLTDTSLMEKIQNASSPIEAKQLAAQYLQDPKAQYELNAAKVDILLKQAQLAKVQRETREIGEPTAAEKKADAAALKEAKASIPVMQDKIGLIDSLETHKGLASSVGAIPLTRVTVTAGVTGSAQDFAAKIHKLTGGLTLDNLIAAKARGATFGALSEGELRILASSATALNDWEVKAKNPKTGQVEGTGKWAIDEASFKKELENIKTLTARAIAQSQGNVFSGDESNLLDELYQSQGVINPATFY